MFPLLNWCVKYPFFYLGGLAQWFLSVLLQPSLNQKFLCKYYLVKMFQNVAYKPTVYKTGV